MNAIVTIDAAAIPPETPACAGDQGPAPIAGPHGEGHTIFSPPRQADFLASLALNGNVRLACRAAAVSPQTAYRARRASPAFALAWDTALLAARAHAEEVLADRAINGVEEAVFYHGEEVARRRRYDSRLLLAHLARLDRLAERAEVAATLPLLDEQIEGLRRGEELPEPPRENFSQDCVPCVPSCGNGAGRSSIAPSPPCRDCGGFCETEGVRLGPDDCQWLGNRIARMDAARPEGALLPHQLGDADTVESLQLEAFECDLDEWWLIVSEEQMYAMMREQWNWAALEEDEGEGEEEEEEEEEE